LRKQANSSPFLKSLHNTKEEEALGQLLAHLPLLDPGNMEARSGYIKLLTKVMLRSSVELDYLHRCRQLLSLALVHPAFSHMLSLGDLESMTKGARRKLIESIEELVRRQETLEEIELKMSKDGYLIQCFQELQQMLQTPIEPYRSGDSENLPSLTTRAISKGF
jgi:hypothetical protein